MVESIKELRKICYEGRKTPMTPYNRYVCVKFSIYITKLLLYTPITANQVTIMMLLFGIVGPIFLFAGHFIIGLIFLHLSVVLDDVDGEVARYRKHSSMEGMYIDQVYHVVTDHLMFFGYAYGIYRVYPNSLILILGFLAAVFSKSIVVPSIFDTIITMRLRGISAPIRKHTDGKEAKEISGQAKEYKDKKLYWYHTLKKIWEFPSNLVWLTLLYIWESVNANLAVLPPYFATLTFFAAYSFIVIFSQIASFVVHTRRNSIDSFYVFLFGKK